MFIKNFGLILLATYSLSALALAPFIDDGIKAAAKEFPAVVKIGLYEKRSIFELDKGLCTGTLIAPDIVLTAAHCANADTNVIQRVSLSGDSRGVTEKIGIKVKKTFVNPIFEKNLELENRMNQFVGTEDFRKLPEEKQQNFIMKLMLFSDINNSGDIAFLQLEKEQVIDARNIVEMGCKVSAPEGLEITMAGYGLKSINDALENSNPDFVLNYGTNKLARSPLPGQLYKIIKAKNKQLMNNGDSGGPLFLKNDQKTVYGVASTTGRDEFGISAESVYANLNSKAAKVFYQSLLADKSLPPTLKSIISNCL